MQDNDLRFDEWNKKKKEIAKTKPKNKPQVKGIYWINMGLNLGNEVYGKGKDFSRPVLVLKTFYNDLFLGVPLSSKQQNKTGKLYHKFVDSRGKTQVALLSQIRALDNKRKYRYIGKINDEDFKIIKEKLIKIIE